jgi:F-type H+-transporting ATPase subunit gamma
MANAKDIRTQIKSIKSTQKITRAMEMVAASKMRRAQERMRASRPYSERIRNVISHLAMGRLEYHHPYLEEREPKRVGFIVVATDRGLCGGLNANLFRAAVQSMKNWHEQNIPIDICTIGRKSEGFFRRLGGNVLASITQLGDKPKVQDIIGAVRAILDEYDDERLDRVYLVYNEFVNTMKQTPRVELLLPIIPAPKDPQNNEVSHYAWDYIYEPDAKQLLDSLLVRYIESLAYQGVVENGACEQAARMVAMKSASENAAELISDLQLAYNKARQAAITRELSEIVAGAAAV